MRAVSAAYRWPGLHGQVAEVVRGCEACSRAKSAAVLKNPVLQPLPIVQYFHRVSFDLAGPFPPSRYSSTYILISVEHVSRCLFTAGLPNKEAISVGRKMREWFGIWGAVGGEALTDNGGEFVNAEIAKLLEERFISHRTTSANHPQGNGLSERAVRTVKTLLTACIEDPALDSDWEDLLGSITLAYNATPQASTGFAPYTLMYGRAVGLPVTGAEAALRVPVGGFHTDLDAVVQDYIRRIALLRAAVPMAMGSLSIAQQRQTYQYAQRRGGGYTFAGLRVQVGNLAYIRDRYAQALEPGVQQPVLEVVQVRASGVVILQGPSGRTVHKHMEDVIPCHLNDRDMSLRPDQRGPTEEESCELCGVKQQERRGLWAMLACEICGTCWHLRCLQGLGPTALRSMPAKDVPWVCQYCVDLLRVPYAVLPSGLPAATALAALVQPLDENCSTLDLRRPEEWELTSSAAVTARLQSCMPGFHGPNRGAVMFHRLPLQRFFHPGSNGFLPTGVDEYGPLQRWIRWDRLELVLDPWAGVVGATAAALGSLCPVVLSDAVQRTPRLAALANALEPSDMSRVVHAFGRPDAVVASPFYALNDLA